MITQKFGYAENISTSANIYLDLIYKGQSRRVEIGNALTPYKNTRSSDVISYKLNNHVTDSALGSVYLFRRASVKDRSIKNLNSINFPEGLLYVDNPRFVFQINYTDADYKENTVQLCYAFYLDDPATPLFLRNDDNYSNTVGGRVTLDGDINPPYYVLEKIIHRE